MHQANLISNRTLSNLVPYLGPNQWVLHRAGQLRPANITCTYAAQTLQVELCHTSGVGFVGFRQYKCPCCDGMGFEATATTFVAGQDRNRKPLLSHEKFSADDYFKMGKAIHAYDQVASTRSSLDGFEKAVEKSQNAVDIVREVLMNRSVSHIAMDASYSRPGQVWFRNETCLMAMHAMTPASWYIMWYFFLQCPCGCGELSHCVLSRHAIHAMDLFSIQAYDVDAEDYKLLVDECLENLAHPMGKGYPHGT